MYFDAVGQRQKLSLKCSRHAAGVRRNLRHICGTGQCVDLPPIPAFWHEFVASLNFLKASQRSHRPLDVANLACRCPIHLSSPEIRANCPLKDIRETCKVLMFRRLVINPLFRFHVTCSPRKFSLDTKELWTWKYSSTSFEVLGRSESRLAGSSRLWAWSSVCATLRQPVNAMCSPGRR